MMSRRAGNDGETGGKPGAPDIGRVSREIPGAAPSGHDSRLRGFAKDGEWDAALPSAALAAALQSASGPEWRSPGASRDELFGLLRQWQAMEAWAAAARG